MSRVAGPKGIATRIQATLANLYALDAPAIEPYLRPGDREQVFVKMKERALEVSVVLPKAAFSVEARLTLDELCQVIEGVSHFLCIVERARRKLPVTLLELELQAEVDKYLLLRRSVERAPLRERLYGNVRYLHSAETEEGHRYRLAGQIAARFVSRLDAEAEISGREERATLLKFHAAGQREKLEMVMAA